MSNILENLARILNARYGKDVRQSIHDAILNCYEDGKAGAIDLQARADIEEEAQNRQQADESINQSIDDIAGDMADLQPKTDAELTTESKEIVGAVNELNKNLSHKANVSTFKKDTTGYGVRIDTENADGNVIERIQTHKDSTDGNMHFGAFNMNPDDTVRDRVQIGYNGTNFVALGQLNNSAIASKRLVVIDDINAIFKLVTYSVKYSIAANSSASYTITTNIPDGYRILGVIRYTTNYKGAVPYAITIASNNIIVGLDNIEAQTIGNTFACLALLVKSSFVE